MPLLRLRPKCFLPTVLAASLVLPACAPGPPTSLVFVSLDTTRRDHLSLYGYHRETSPALEELGARGAVFENATAQMTITNPSHASMFTGLYPHTHQVGSNTRRLADENVTLTEVLRDRGYATAGFVSGHPLRAEITGIDQGFDHYDSELNRRRKGRLTLDRALAWLGRREPERPFFLFLHLYDAHGPYKISEARLEGFRSPELGPEIAFIPQYQKLRDDDGELLRHRNLYLDRYDALLRYQDDLLRELLGAIDPERTLVAVVSDHGETLFERGDPLTLNHGTSVFEEQIAIPMVISGPGIAPGRHQRLAETVDLMPTLLDLLGVPADEQPAMEGESLAELAAEGDAAADNIAAGLAFASNRARTKNHRHRGLELRKREFIHSVRDGAWKLIRYPGVERDYVELYDLNADPGEQRNIYEEERRTTRRLLSELDSWRRDLSSDEEGVSEQDREALEALGYIG